MKIVVANTKGGASKSTVAFQIASAYMLDKGLDFTHFEFDDENLDANVFTETKIKREQIPVETGDDLAKSLKEIIWERDNFVIDVGGNKTTTIFFNALKKSRTYKDIDLFIIPSSGGSQDIINMKKTYEIITDIDPKANILFALSRVRSPKRVEFQYEDFFKAFPKADYFILKDSDVVDMSRKLKKSIYEIMQDDKSKEKLEKLFDEAYEKRDKQQMYALSTMLEIMDESEEYYENYIKEAFKALDKALAK